jgi:hypothetical protein
MKKINKGAKAAILNNNGLQQNLNDIIQNRITGTQPKLEHSKHYYRGDKHNHNHVIYKLLELYNKKCAFCEKEYNNLDVDHYRPKDAVFEDNRHSGYFWIGYEWSNLLPVCKSCNQDYKKTQFPLKKTGKRLKFSTSWSQNDFKKVEFTNLDNINKLEKPLLLNPEEKDFNPKKHIKFNRDGIPTGLSVRGSETIRICGLDNSTLNKHRKEKFDEILVTSLLIFYRNHDLYNDERLKDELLILFQKIKSNFNEEYSLFWKTSVSDLQHFIFDNPLFNLKSDHRLTKLIKEVCLELKL